MGARLQAANPEPADWFVGDMHVHRSCGTSPVTMASISNAMVAANLSVVSVLADMGNGEVQNPTTDLPKVNGTNAPESPPGRIIRWDAEWHWDATYNQFPHQALGGHIVALGLTNAVQIWNESTYPIIQWAQQQGGIAGFAHFQYLPDNSFPTTLDCCLPIEYPVEVALGTCDFISEDVAGANSAMLAYYRLLNCGFRPGFAGGSDYPCAAQIGDVATFVKVSGPLTYQKWIEGIRDGRTVVSRNGRKEFLNLAANTNSFPGDEIYFPAGGGTVNVSAVWSANTSLSGTIEIVKNGVVITNKPASITGSSTSALTASITFTNSGWLAARRMDGGGEHRAQTAAIFVNVDNQPVRASVADAQFYVNWMDQLIARVQAGGAWAGYFSSSNRPTVLARYQAARSIYVQIAAEAAALIPPVITTSNLPSAFLNSPYAASLSATGGTAPYTWTILGGALPAGLALNTNTGAISGTPSASGPFNFTVRVADAGIPAQTNARALTLTVDTFNGSLGLIGNTNNGTSQDTIWDNGSYINASRFQAASNMTVALMRAKVSGITGSYKCAIFTDSGGQPNRLFRSTTAVTNPATGWQTFSLVSPAILTNGSYYWLAIWSDSASAKVYYSDTNGTLRWGKYAYGSWPDPLTTSGGSTLKYSIYATGGSAPVFAATPTNRTIPELTLLTVTNAATDSDVPAQSLSYQLVNAPSNAVINASGVITWTPSEAQGPSTNQIMTVVSDGVASVTNSFQVIVLEVNTAPVFAATPTNRTIPELTSLTVTNNATDSDVPAQSLSYQLVNAPSNAVINASGVITWTPSEAQGPSTNQIVTVVSDGVASATNSFQVIVLEVNTAPVFAATPTNRTIPELTLLTVTNAATDSDVPAQSLSYQLVNAPSNAVINASGVITWSPSEAQGPSTNQIMTVVSDGVASVTNSFEVVVEEVNVAPEFVETPTNLVIPELTLLTVTNDATDSDVPAQSLSYQLVNAPSNAVIDASGVIAWTPSEAQGPSTNQIMTVVSDGVVNVTNSFEVVVEEANVAPAFVETPTNLVIPELTLLTVTNSATDADVPEQTLSYQLVNAPSNAVINASGVITWTASEAQGPSTNQIMTVVSDGVASVTNSFEVVVEEVNVAPMFDATPTDKTIADYEMLCVTNSATDADMPADELSYNLISSPTNAFISTNGMITWMPSPGQAPSTNLFTTVVGDGTEYATNSFVVTVLAPLVAPSIVSIEMIGEDAVVVWTSVSGQSYVLEYLDDVTGTNWSVNLPGIVASGGFSSATNPTAGAPMRIYRVRSPE